MFAVHGLLHFAFSHLCGPCYGAISSDAETRRETFDEARGRAIAHFALGRRSFGKMKCTNPGTVILRKVMRDEGAQR